MKAAGVASVGDVRYNANPDSVRAAIDVLVTSSEPPALVIGDMGAVGEHGDEFHGEVCVYAKTRGVSQLPGVGEATRHTVAAFGEGAQHFGAVQELVKSIQATTVLVKGSRFMMTERVVAALTNDQHAA